MLLHGVDRSSRPGMKMVLRVVVVVKVRRRDGRRLRGRGCANCHPNPRQPQVPTMALSEPILPSFSTFASPCRERGLQEVRAAGTAGGGGGWLRVAERGLRGRRTQAAGTAGSG